MKIYWIINFILVQNILSAQIYFHPIDEDRKQNWGIIEKDILYRSKKLSNKALESRITKYNLKSILCLAECDDWESYYANFYRIKYYKFPLNISEIQLQDAVEIVKFLKNSPKPLLIHCRKGADRTGMAAVLYYYSIKKMNMKQAKKYGLKLFYGHFHTWATHRIYEVLDEFEMTFPHL